MRQIGFWARIGKSVETVLRGERVPRLKKRGDAVPLWQRRPVRATPPGRMRAYVGVGTNLGDRWAHLALAARGLKATPRVAVPRASRVFDTAPLGPPQPRFLNAVLELETGLTPEALLAALRRLEQEALRRPAVRWGPRSLDLDLLLFGDLVLRRPGLTVPHPGLAARRFVLQPLASLCPDRPVPGLGRTVAALLAEAPSWDLVDAGLYPT